MVKTNTNSTTTKKKVLVIFFIALSKDITYFTLVDALSVDKKEKCIFLNG